MPSHGLLHRSCFPDGNAWGDMLPAIHNMQVRIITMNVRDLACDSSYCALQRGALCDECGRYLNQGDMPLEAYEAGLEREMRMFYHVPRTHK